MDLRRFDVYMAAELFISGMCFLLGAGMIATSFLWFVAPDCYIAFTVGTVFLLLSAFAFVVACKMYQEND